MLSFHAVKVDKPDECNCIIGQSHFIKTVEDLAEVLVGAVPGILFGLAFAEASGACKVRSEGTDQELKARAASIVLSIAAGHTFVILLRNAFPLNVLNAVKMTPEVCSVFCASANPLEVVVAETENGRGIIGVIDGKRPAGIENTEDIAWRTGLLRSLGYKK